MLGAVSLSVALFLFIFMLMRAEGDEAPWFPAGVAAGGAMLLAAVVREIVLRRAWARYLREMETEMWRGETARRPAKSVGVSSGVQAWTSAFRSLQQRLAELDGATSAPDAHREASRLCEQFLANVEDALRPASGAEARAALLGTRDRVRVLQKKYKLAWARGEATRLTQEAQRRVRVSDKIETARLALEVLDEALKYYPEEQELVESSTALRNFIASVKVGQWVEMAERSAFRGKYARAISRYGDALFYLSRADMGEDARAEAAGRIQREIELLRARQATAEGSFVRTREHVPGARRGGHPGEGGKPENLDATPLDGDRDTN